MRRARLAPAIASVAAALLARPAAPAPLADASYRVPSAPVVRLLTADPPPQPILHLASGRVALLFREGVIHLARLARPRLGLAGYRFDPISRTSGVQPLVERVEVPSVDAPADRAPTTWRPRGGGLLAHVHFSPDGRRLSALLVPEDGPARLALFDVASGEERVLDAPVNAAWGDPCTWVAPDALLCRLVPPDAGAPPPARIAPAVVEHKGRPAPLRTAANLLETAYEDALFAHYFTVELGRVTVDGSVERLPVTRGLLSHVRPSPDGAFAEVTRLAPPFPRLVGASRFPSTIEIWDCQRGERRYASEPAGFGVDASSAAAAARRFAWKPGAPLTLGWITGSTGTDAPGAHRWMATTAPFSAPPHEIARSERPIGAFGWTTAGTPFFTTATDEPSGVRVLVVTPQGPHEIWRGATTDRYGSPGRALRVNGAEGPVLEVDGRIFLAGDGLGPGGARPFLDAYDLRTAQRTRLFTAEPGVFEVVLGVLDPQVPRLLTSRETATEPPNLFVVDGGARRAIRPYATPYPDLVGVERRLVEYRRADGVALSGTLYLPAGRRAGERLPALVWIYPWEFDDREQAEQLDVRGFQFHQVKGPSPLALVLEGYAVLVNPTVPIVQEGAQVNDDYLPQLVASTEAAVDHLVAIGVADPERIAVGGRSYGAFSSANLLVHSRRFAAAVVMSGAYNRTLTPFGFQHERRAFWDATEFYARISPFFHVDQIEAPILVVHGGADDNPGTPTLQARRFFHALVGRGVSARYVELPFEGHQYWARENVLEAAAEMIGWLERTIGRGHARAAAAPR